MGESNHPDHGELTTRVLNDRIHDDKEVIKCERCNTLVDEVADLDDVECDHHKRVSDGITGNLSGGV